MPIVSAVFSYVQGTYGWTEKLFIERTSENLNDYYNTAVTLLGKRMRLSGAQTQAQYLRLSREDVQFDSLLFRFQPNMPSPTTDEASDAPTTCLLLQCSDVLRQFRKNIFIRGIWDSVVAAGGSYVPTPGYTALVNSYWGQLKLDGWGWLASDRPGITGIIDDITQDPSGQVRVTFAANFFDAGQVGKNVQVRFSRIDTPGNLNGQAVMIPESETVAVSLRRIAVLPYTFGGQARRSTRTLKATDFAVAERIGEHRTGRPILQPRGRYLPRKRG